MQLTQQQVAELEEASANAGKRLTAHLAQLGEHERELVVGLTAQVQSLLSIGQLALFGYDAAQAGHTSFSSMQLAAPTLAWAGASSRQKAALVVVGVFSSTLADLLEAFLGEFSYGNPELELHRRSDGSEWVSAIELVFDIELPSPARVALSSLIDVRRAFTSELQALPAGPRLVQFYAAWPSVTLLLTEAVVAKRAEAQLARSN